jgi:hypothetical protein
MMFYASSAHACDPCEASLSKVGVIQSLPENGSSFVGKFTFSAGEAPVGLYVYGRNSSLFIDPAYAQLERLVGDEWVPEALEFEDASSSTRATRVKPGRTLSFKVDLSDAIFAASAREGSRYEYRLTVFLDNGCKVSSERFQLPAEIPPPVRY